MDYVDNALESMVEISKIVTSSRNFFSIKDLVVDKMLEVIPPKRACVNIFKNNTYEYTYLVCKHTLDNIPDLVGGERVGSDIKLDFNVFPDYIQDAIDQKKSIYIEDIFKQKEAEKEVSLAKMANYKGRIVVPLISSDIVRGFMTCFVNYGEELSKKDIKFINSVASLLALSIEITYQNKEIDDIIKKFRDSIISLENRTDMLYEGKGLDSYLKLISQDICDITSSESVFIFIEDEEANLRLIEGHGNTKKLKYAMSFLQNIKDYDKKIYDENSIPVAYRELGIKSIAFENILKNDVEIGKLLLINSEKYNSDDIKILSIYSTQIVLSLFIYINNKKMIENSFIHRDLELVHQQQFLIMQDEIMNEDENLIVDYENIPYKYVGGDFCKFKQIDDDKYVLFMADVMGHGLMSNYFVAMMKGAVNLLLSITPSPSTILTELNNVLFKELDKQDVFITAKMILFDFKTMNAYSSSAGHTNPIAIYKDENNKRQYKILNGTKEIALGIFEDTKYVEDNIKIDDVELFAIYTDGIIETKNENSEEYGVDRLANYLIKELDNNNPKPCSNIKQVLLDFSGNREIEDDITILTIKKK